MRILVDIDNTIERLMEVWCAALYKRYGILRSPEDITEWNMEQFYAPLTIGQIMDVVEEEGFWKKVQPEEGAVDYLKQIMDDGDEVYLCSASGVNEIAPKYRDFIHKYFPFVDWKHMIFCGCKQMIKGDILIDDCPANLTGGEYQGILYSQPHNLYYDAQSNGVWRADSWKEIYVLIQQFKKGHS